MNVKYFIKKFEWMKVYFSPFKPPIPKIYIGKTAIGTPYFFPRRWVKYTTKDAIKAATRAVNNEKLVKKPFGEWIEYYKMRRKPIPKKIGFDFVGLGWKTKWTDTDYIFEWSPVWSFVFFGYQIAITFVPIEQGHFWECWLYYSRETKGTLKERLEQSRKEFPCVWHFIRNGIETKICYWDIILKNK